MGLCFETGACANVKQSETAVGLIDINNLSKFVRCKSAGLKPDNDCMSSNGSTSMDLIDLSKFVRCASDTDLDRAKRIIQSEQDKRTAILAAFSGLPMEYRVRTALENSAMARLKQR